MTMKIVILAIGLCLLLSCIKEPPPMPEVTTAQGKACLRECQFNLSLCNAGCSYETANMKQCENNCLDILGDCYTTCE
jgi:hypothetical protein